MLKMPICQNSLIGINYYIEVPGFSEGNILV